ncbi:MAG: hypothetical protein ABW223_08165, partial [Rariglobus sp.]
RALEVYRPLVVERRGQVGLELAAKFLNLSQVCGMAGLVEEALQAGRDALAICEGAECEGESAQALGLRSRHSLCVVLGRLLVPNARDSSPAFPAWLAEASDLVEDALSERGGRGGSAEVTQTALRLFEFGAWLYRTHQPQFLKEFLLEYTGDDLDRARVAAAAVAAARQGLVQRDFNDQTHGGSELLARVVKDLVEVDNYLLLLNSKQASSRA